MNQWLQLQVPTETPIGYHTRPPTPSVGHTQDQFSRILRTLYTYQRQPWPFFRAISLARVRAVRRWWLPGLSSCTEEPSRGSIQVRFDGGWVARGRSCCGSVENHRRSPRARGYCVFPIFPSCLLLVSLSLIINHGGGASIPCLYTRIRIADLSGNARGADRGMGRNTVRVGESYCLRKDSRQAMMGRKVLYI